MRLSRCLGAFRKTAQKSASYRFPRGGQTIESNTSWCEKLELDQVENSVPYLFKWDSRSRCNFLKRERSRVHSGESAQHVPLIFKKHNGHRSFVLSNSGDCRNLPYPRLGVTRIYPTQNERAASAIKPRAALIKTQAEPAQVYFRLRSRLPGRAILKIANPVARIGFTVSLRFRDD